MTEIEQYLATVTKLCEDKKKEFDDIKDEDIKLKLEWLRDQFLGIIMSIALKNIEEAQKYEEALERFQKKGEHQSRLIHP
jgi:hypothetical protein